MLTRRQQILIKRAQQAAALSDEEYRDAVALVSGMPDCRSSKDARLTDGQVDNLLAYFEAIHWRKVDSGAVQPSCKPDAVFRQRDYWATKNIHGNTSRDRYADNSHQAAVTDLENQMHALGFGMGYLRAIQNRIQPFSLAKYAAALKRTLAYKQKLADHDPENEPF